MNFEELIECAKTKKEGICSVINFSSFDTMDDFYISLQNVAQAKLLGRESFSIQVNCSKPSIAELLYSHLNSLGYPLGSVSFEDNKVYIKLV